MIKISPIQKEGYELFHDGMIEFARIEQNGIRIDLKRLESTKAELRKKIQKLQIPLEADRVWSQWQKQFGSKANMGSHKQLSQIFHVELEYKVEDYTESGEASTDEEALRKIDHPFIEPYIRWSKYSKALSTYIRGIEREVCGDRIHPSFNLNTVRSMRGSCSDPNFQNQPTRDKEIAEIIRSLFIPSPDSVIVENDFKGVEVGVSACVVGSTLIETIDGPVSILGISRKLKFGQKVFVYGYGLDKRRIQVSQVTDAEMTRKKARIWEVLLDNGEKVCATGDHKFLLRTGEYKELCDLMPGESLMPFYKERKVSQWKTVYEKVYLNNGESILAHNLIARDVCGVEIAGSNKVVHHKNGIGTDNSLGNLEIMTRRRHMRIHSKQGWKNKGMGKRMTGWWNSEFVAKMNQERKEQWTADDWARFSQKVSDGIKRKGPLRGARNGMFGKKHSDTTIQKMREVKIGFSPNIAKERWPEIVKKILETKRRNGTNHGNKGYWKGKKRSPLKESTKLKLSLAMKGRKFSRQTRLRIKQASKRRWERVWKLPPSKACPFCKKTFVTMGSHVRHKHKNHKVVEVRETDRFEDVYNLNVEGCHNYALAAGVVIKNCVHKDKNFISYIITPGKDMHRDMAAQVYCQEPKDVSKDARYGAKNKFVFPQFYGDYYVACARNCWEWIAKGNLTTPDGVGLYDHLRAQGIKSLGACDPEQKPKKGTFEYHVQQVEDDFWNNRFRDYGQWRRDWFKAYQRKGYFDLMSGFRIHGFYNRNAVCNYPIQGPAFHCLLWSLIQINRELRKRKMRSMVIGQIHDSLIGDVRVDELQEYLEIVEDVIVHRLPKHYQWLIVPLEVEYEITPSNGTWFQKQLVAFKNGKFLNPNTLQPLGWSAEKYVQFLDARNKSPRMENN